MAPRAPLANGRIPLAAARRMALAAQGFCDPTPSGRVDRRHLRRAMARLQLLQLDSVPVVMRSQYLPLYSRLGPYREGLLDELAYGQDEWFEAWAHEASLLPVELEPWLRWAKQRAARGETHAGLHRFAREQRSYVASVLRQVERRGPLLARELEDPKRRAGAWWSGRSLGHVALDWLFRTGRLGIRRVANFEKQWDLLERIVPSAVCARPTPAEDEAQRALLLRAAAALGVATAVDLADYFRIPIRMARARVAELVEGGHLEEGSVEGWGAPAYHLPSPRLPRQVRARALLSPFDPLVWNRERAERLFGFRYRIEIYVPAARRRHGYYVLPFLLGDRLVARVDLKNDRVARRLRVQAAFVEPDAEREGVAVELRAELARLATMVGAESLAFGRRGDLMRSLARAPCAA